MDVYKKFENRLLIGKIFEKRTSLRDYLNEFSNNLRWEKVFFKELFRAFKNKYINPNHLLFISLLYFLMYCFHWILIGISFHSFTSDHLKSLNSIATLLIHVHFILIVIVIFWFNRSDLSILPKKQLMKDRDSNLIGFFLETVET